MTFSDFYIFHILDCYLPLSFSALSLSLSRSNFCRERFVLQTFLSEPKWNRSLIRPFQGAAASFLFSGAPSPSLAGGFHPPLLRGSLHPFLFSGAPSPSLARGDSIRPIQGAAASFPFFRGSESFSNMGGIPSAPVRGPLHPFLFFRGSESFPCGGGGVFHPPFQGAAATFHFQGLQVLSEQGFHPPLSAGYCCNLSFFRGSETFPSAG